MGASIFTLITGSIGLNQTKSASKTSFGFLNGTVSTKIIKFYSRKITVDDSSLLISYKLNAVILC